MVDNHESKPPVTTGKKAYDKQHRNICEKLRLAEVHANRVLAQSTRKRADGKIVTVNYDRQGKAISSTASGNPNLIGRTRFQNLVIPERDSRLRVQKMTYLSHVITQCGLREKAVRPLWRLLLVGYKIRISNFKRLVSKVARLCNCRHDFTRDLGAPAKGLHQIPRFMREAEPLVVKGIYVPRWTYTPKFLGDVRDLNLD